MRARILLVLAIAFPPWISTAAQESPGHPFDRAYPAVVQVLVSTPDGIRQGSGFVVDAGGVVLTHAELLADAQTIFVRPSAEDSYYRAGLVAVDDARGIAALQVATASLPALEIAPASTLRAGTRVTALGVAPEGGEPVTHAIVGSRLPEGEGFALEPAGPVSPDLSGAPVLSDDGGVVAMLVAREETSSASGVVAQPLEPARELLGELGIDAPAEKTSHVVGAEAAARDVPDVSGRWILENTILHTPHAPYEGLRLGFELTLQQVGQRVTGEGRKVSENGRPLAAAARSPIWLEGTLEGNTLTATFRERGARRTIHGVFAWFVDADRDELGGRFADTGSLTRGESRGRRAD